MRADDVLLCDVGGTGLWVKPRGPALDEPNARALTDVVLGQVFRTGRSHVYLDLCRVKVLDHFVLARLVALHFRLAQLGGRLYLVQPRPEIYFLLRRHGLARVLHIHGVSQRPFYYAARTAARLLGKKPGRCEGNEP